MLDAILKSEDLARLLVEAVEALGADDDLRERLRFAIESIMVEFREEDEDEPEDTQEPLPEPETQPEPNQGGKTTPVEGGEPWPDEGVFNGVQASQTFLGKQHAESGGSVVLLPAKWNNRYRGAKLNGKSPSRSNINWSRETNRSTKGSTGKDNHNGIRRHLRFSSQSGRASLVVTLAEPAETVTLSWDWSANGGRNEGPASKFIKSVSQEATGSPTSNETSQGDMTPGGYDVELTSEPGTVFISKRMEDALWSANRIKIFYNDRDFNAKPFHVMKKIGQRKYTIGQQIQGDPYTGFFINLKPGLDLASLKAGPGFIRARYETAAKAGSPWDNWAAWIREK